jgi:LPXTG-motif cell wall-anchored protein
MSVRKGAGVTTRRKRAAHGSRSRSTRIATGALVLAGAGLTVSGVANAMDVPSGSASVSVTIGSSPSGGGLLGGSSPSGDNGGDSATPSPTATPTPPASATASGSVSPSAAPSQGQPVAQQSPPSQRLAETGGSSEVGLLAAGGAALVAGGLVFRFGPRRQRQV